MTAFPTMQPGAARAHTLKPLQILAPLMY